MVIGCQDILQTEECYNCFMDVTMAFAMKSVVFVKPKQINP